MKTRAPFLIALLCGIACAAALYAYMSMVQTEAANARSEALARYGGDQIEVCVATRDIAPGEEINSSNTTMREWLVDLLPAQACESLDEINGKQVTSAIVAGEVISKHRFEGESVSIIVPAGLQAVSVELGDAQAVAGMLQAGSIVDVYAAGTQTDLLVSQVLVTAIEQGTTGNKRVTLAVAPEYVQQIIATTQQSSLYLVLPSNESSKPAQGTTKAEQGASKSKQDASKPAQDAGVPEKDAGNPEKDAGNPEQGTSKPAQEAGEQREEAQGQANQPSHNEDETQDQKGNEDV